MSERQIGLFVAAHLLHVKEATVLMVPSRVEFRNAVIHKGRIPSREEAISCLDDILNLVMPLVLKVKMTMGESIQELVFDRIRGFAANLGTQPHSTMSTGCTMGLVLSTEVPHPTSIMGNLKIIEDRKYRG